MIDILMATYNGEKYLEEQLDSIINQTYEDWRLIIADDCSQDNTMKILEKYHAKYPEKISYYQNSKPSGSAKNNFFQLLEHATSDYVMFSDQDDVWLKDKLEVTYKAMIEAENENKNKNKNVPILVHSDLCVVNEKLEVINPSIFKMQDMDYRKSSLNNILVSNIVTGCTMMVNRALLDLVYRKPKNAIMHDMWLALIASAFGKIVFIKEPTILYRQHGDNSVGAKNVHTLDYFLDKLFNYNALHNSLLLQYSQAGEFLDVFQDKLSNREKEFLKIYSNFDESNAIDRYMCLRKYNMFKVGVIKQISQLFI